MNVFRAQPFAIRPNAAQSTVLNRLAGGRRAAWNKGLEQGVEVVEKLSLPSWFTQLPKGLAKYAMTDLARSAHPKFLAKAFDRPHFRLSKYEAVIRGRTLSIPKLEIVLRMRGYRPVPGDVCSVAFTRTPNGWDCSVLYATNVDDHAYDPDIELVGIDVGLSTLATLSDGTTVDRPEFNAADSDKAERIRTALKRMTKGSNNYLKLGKRLAKIYRRMRNRRTNFIHQTSRKIVDKYDGVAVETLDINAMAEQKPWLKNSIINNALGKLLFQLDYKCRDAGKPCVKVGQWFPSSKTCHECGHVNRNLTLEDRIFDCPRCKYIADRDFNAALNIRDKAMETYHETTRRGTPCKAPDRK